MADLEKTVSILFKGVDEISGTMDTISGSMSTFGGKLESATDPLAKMALTVEKLDGALVALAVGGLVYAFSKYSDLATAVAELDKVLGDNAGGLEAAKKNAYDLSEQYGVSMVKIVGSTADFVQAGFTIDESMKLVKNSMDLVIAGSIDSGNASEYLVRTLKGFKAPAEDAARLVDVLNEVSNVYATDVKQLAEGMSRIAPIASIMGLSFEHTAALLTPIIEVFGSGAEAADALKIGLLKLSDDAKPITSALYNMGIAQKDYNGELRPTRDILADVQAKFTTLTAEQKLFYTSQLVGLEQAPRMIEVFNGGAKAAEVLKTALNSAGSAAEEVTKQLETPEKQIAILQQSLVNLSEAIAEKFGKSATGVISSSNEIVLALQTALGKDAFNSILGAIDYFLIDFSKYLKDVAKAVPEAMSQINFEEFKGSLKDLKGAVGDIFKAMFGEVDLRKPEDLAKALQKIVDAGTKLAEFSTGIAEGQTPFAKWLGEWAKKALEADTETVKLSGRMSGFGQGINTVVMALNLLGPAISIFSGALIIDGIATLGKLAAALVSIPVTVTTAGLLALGYAANSLNPPIDLATARFDEFGNLVGDFEKKSAAAIKGIKDISQGLLDLPAASFVLEGDTSEAEQKILKFNTDLQMLSDFTSWTIEPILESNDELNKLIDEMQRLSNGTAIVLSTDKESVKKSFDDIVSHINDLPFGMGIPLSVILDPGSLANARAELDGFRIDENGKFVNIQVGYKKEELERTQKKIDEEIPSEKMMQIKLQGNIDKDLALIKAGAETVQKKMEFTAKIKTAEVEGDAKRMASAFESASSGVASYSKQLSSLFDKDWNKFDFSQYSAIRDSAAQALKFQKEMHNANLILIEAQVKYEESKIARLKSNKALINIDSTGLEPSLEMIMWQILQKVQLKANELSAEFLLGIK